jgi:hypothetical protein
MVVQIIIEHSHRGASCSRRITQGGATKAGRNPRRPKLEPFRLRLNCLSQSRSVWPANRYQGDSPSRARIFKFYRRGDHRRCSVFRARNPCSYRFQVSVGAALVVADVLKRQGFVARTAESPTVVEADNARTICVCFLEDVTEARTDFTQRKLSRQAPSAKIVVCLLGEPKDIKDSEEPRADVPSRSSKNVLLALEKNAAPSIRSEL